MGQKLYKFRGSSLDDAYQQMRQRLGKDALVVSTHEVPVRGVMGLLGRRMVEVTASAPASSRPQQSARSSRSRTAVERRYSDGTNPAAAPGDPNLAYYEKLLTNAQKRMADTEQRLQLQETPAQSSKTETTGSASSVVPFPRREPDVESVESMRQQMREMREMLQVLMAESPGAGLPQEYGPHYRQLVDSGLSRKAAASLVAAAAHAANAEVLRDPLVFRERLKVEIRDRKSVV